MWEPLLSGTALLILIAIAVFVIPKRFKKNRSKKYTYYDTTGRRIQFRLPGKL